MLHIVEGNMFDSNFDAYVITVNCVGTSGKGLAREWAMMYPHLSARYTAHCKNVGMRPGEVLIYRGSGRTFLLAATKDHWRNNSKLEWVEEALNYIHLFGLSNHTTIALPPLGAGLGGLDGREVLKLVQARFGADDPFDVYYFLPR